MRIFGIEIMLGGEDIEDAVVFEELDEQSDIDDALDAWEDDDSEGYMYDTPPPKQRVWWRL